ncbi:MAG: hypothetical protein ACTS85_02330 [Arsenophonus sp. NC-PG7-MAG3]
MMIKPHHQATRIPKSELLFRIANNLRLLYLNIMGSPDFTVVKLQKRDNVDDYNYIPIILLTTLSPAQEKS